MPVKWFARARLVCALLLFSAPAFAAPTLYQWCSIHTGGTNLGSLACGSTSGDNHFANTQVQPNHLLIVSVRSNVTVTGVADTLGLSWSTAAPGFGPTGSSTFFYAQTGAISASNDTITVTISTPSPFWGLEISECAGCTTSVGSSPVVCQTIVSSVTSASCVLTTLANNDLVIGAGRPYSANTATAGAGFTMRATESTQNGIFFEDAPKSTAGAITAAVSGPNSEWLFQAAAFRTTGSFTYVTTSNGYNGGTNQSTSTVSINPSAGHFVACELAWIGTGSSMLGVSDSKNDLWLPYSGRMEGTHGEWVWGWYTYNVVGGSTTVTMFGSGMTQPELQCAEYSGVVTASNPLDGLSNSVVYGWAGCSPNCVHSGSGSYTVSTLPIGSLATTGLMAMACGGGTCVSELDATAFNPASGTTTFSVEYGDYTGPAGPAGCGPVWQFIVEDGNNSQWCYAALAPLASGFANAFTF